MDFPLEAAPASAGAHRTRPQPRWHGPPAKRPDCSRHRRTKDILNRGIITAMIAAVAVLGMLPASRANAQDAAAIAPGDAVVTGFSGFQPNGALLVPGMNPLDQFFINPDGPSAQIKSLNLFGEPPQGQLVAPGLRQQIPAKEIGQVFPIALMEGDTATTPPGILLGATSMFGLHIVKPDTNGDGVPERIRIGEAGATWMPGMFADDKGGSPGAIWRVDGQTGEVSLFATIPDNSGPGLGDIVYDKATRQVFVSDLDTGLIHRLDADGQLIDTFDHGADGRPAKGLDPVLDDGEIAEIETPAFETEKPDTWGLTPPERRVHGMAVHQGRLYYTVDKQVWSIGINEDGSFAGDARWELDVATTSDDTQLSDMLFDGQGRMYVAERAAQRNPYDYAHFAEPEKAEVKRYRLEDPDDPATESVWVPDPETYAIGLPAEHRHSNGGIALGFPYDETGMARTGSCGEFLWTTGERLRAGEFAQGDGEGDPAANADVHGLQGNAIDAVRPENVPPMASYFTDYDGFFGDAEKAGHLGDVEIWQPCEGVSTPEFGGLPPWWGDIPEDEPEDYPDEFPEPDPQYETNLELTKWADPGQCFSWGADWLCRYQIRIRNTGPDDYFGDLQFRDTFPANPAGLDTFFQPQPPWFCWQPGGNPADTRCWRPDVFLAAGQSTFMTVWAKVPKNPTRCRLTNVAEIEWAPGGTQWNTDPTDDLDAATAIIPDPECEPDDPKRTDLELKKRAGQCIIAGNNVDCAFRITVENVGANDFFGPITVRDEMPAGTMFMWAPGFNWNCGAVAGPGTSFECKHKNPANVFLQPTDQVNLWVYSRVSIDEARQMNCKLHNRAWIVDPLGPPQNTNPANDKDSATAQMPPEICERPETNLKLTKTASPDTCSQGPGGDYFCRYIIRVINEGPGAYTGTLEVKDTFPDGTDLLLGPGPWTCDPAIGNTKLCKFPGIVNMPKNTARSFPVWLKVPPAVAAQHECRIRNVAKIVKAPGGTPKNTNPADDEDDAVASLPAELCKGPETKTNLEIEKRANGMCQRTGQGIKCDWTIWVKNTGPGQFNGNIVLNETLPGEPLNASWNAPWNCVGAGGGGGAICTHNNASIAAGNAIELNLTTYFSPELAREYQCELTNLVEIAQPAGNTPKNTDPTDDTAQATAQVDPAICQTVPPPPPPPPPTDCPPGYVYDDGQCVPKGGQCPRGWTKTPIRGKCCPPGEPWNGRRCAGYEPPGIIDPIPPPPVFCPRDMKSVSSMRAHYLREQGWTVRRYRGLWCVKPPRETHCPWGYEEVPRSRVDILRERGWTITRVGRGKWCGKEPVIIDCPRGMRPVPASRVPYYKQEGWKLTRLRNGQWCGRPDRTPDWKICPDGTKVPVGRKCPPIIDRCPPGMRQVPVSSYQKLRNRGWTLQFVGKHRKMLCGKPGKQCPRGTHMDDGECVPDSGRACKPPLVGKWPNCRKPDPVCDAKCKCEQSGGTWSHGKCQPSGYICPNGKRVPSKRFCPPDLYTCPNGKKVRNPRQCPPTREPCPPGTIGKFQPNCKVVRKPCPPGTVGKFQPNCKVVRKPCPPGTVGKFQPNCKVVRKPCPPGTVGKFQPNCKRISKPTNPGHNLKKQQQQQRKLLQQQQRLQKQLQRQQKKLQRQQQKQKKKNQKQF